MNEAFILPDMPSPDFRARITRRGRFRAIGARQAKQMALRRFAVLAAALAVPALGAPGGLDQRQPEAVSENAVQPAAAEQEFLAFPVLATLRDLTVPEAIPEADPGPAAQPFRRAGSYLDFSRAQECLTQAIYYEAASESEAGQRAVAQVVLNRVAHPSWPGNVCGVVYQGAERDTGCQFTFTCDGSLTRAPSPAFRTRAARIARGALAGAVHAPVGLATHYHTLEVNPPWAASLAPVAVIGAHRFYRTPGPGGVPAAFGARYAGGEPLPGALAGGSIAETELAMALLAAFPATMPDAVPDAAPEVAPSSASGAAPVEPGLPQAGSGMVRREYARSGSWLTGNTIAPSVNAEQ